jgi:hypothetical protein
MSHPEDGAQAVKNSAEALSALCRAAASGGIFDRGNQLRALNRLHRESADRTVVYAAALVQTPALRARFHTGYGVRLFPTSARPWSKNSGRGEGRRKSGQRTSDSSAAHRCDPAVAVRPLTSFDPAGMVVGGLKNRPNAV